MGWCVVKAYEGLRGEENKDTQKHVNDHMLVVSCTICEMGCHYQWWKMGECLGGELPCEGLQPNTKGEFLHEKEAYE